VTKALQYGRNLNTNFVSKSITLLNLVL
jgi:hypothetical protein